MVVQYTPSQVQIIRRMSLPQILRLFDLKAESIIPFLRALGVSPRPIFFRTAVVEVQLCSRQGVLQAQTRDGGFFPVSDLRQMGYYLAEHLGQDPFPALQLPITWSRRLNLRQIFWEMSLTELGKTPIVELLQAEILPPASERYLQKLLRSSSRKRVSPNPPASLTVRQIFTQMPLSEISKLSLREFFRAKVFD